LKNYTDLIFYFTYFFKLGTGLAIAGGNERFDALKASA
jgi:hypothetical protein